MIPVVIGVRHVDLMQPELGRAIHGSLRFHSGNQPEQHPNLPKFSDHFQNISYA